MEQQNITNLFENHLVTQSKYQAVKIAREYFGCTTREAIDFVESYKLDIEPQMSIFISPQPD